MTTTTDRADTAMYGAKRSDNPVEHLAQVDRPDPGASRALLEKGEGERPLTDTLTIESGLTAAPEEAPRQVPLRPTVRGKFLFLGEEKLYVRGVTYGPFRPNDLDDSGFTPERVAQDFEQIAANGINAVRLYCVPPQWVLDLALRNGLFVMVGLPWEQHVAFLAEADRRRSIEERVREGVRACAGHPAVLCYLIGNEIPSSIVRWHGRRRVERFLKRLYRAAKAEDPEGLVAYSNFPSTEYLRVPFADLLCFNVYLEQQDRLEAYLSRLQNIAGERPLLMAEVGLDSRRNGTDAQAASLEWQVRTSFAAGCAGMFVFAWTDEWHRGGHDILDWDFGLTDRERRPKPALAAVARAFDEAPFQPKTEWPRISVVICTYNGAPHLRKCLEGAKRLRYPDYEVIVVSDGSTDRTAAIASEYEVKLVERRRSGLALARNAGIAASSGEIVAFIDDDAWPDPDWLTYLAQVFASGEWVGVGGPNVPVPDDCRVARCVAHAPGGPTHVLVSDEEAEHIPGCNMAFRKQALEEIGGFDPQFVAAGDDVDICWRLRERGWKLGFSPGAMVLHHRRDTVRGYLRQQRGYGKAEALLERKWPEQYGPAGHVTWRGRLYGNGAAEHRGGRRWRVYYGTWGSGLFQSVYKPAGSFLESLPLMPEWYLVIAASALLGLGGLLWAPLFAAFALTLLATGALIFDAALGAARSHIDNTASRWDRLKLRALTGSLYLLQPVVRLYGRLSHGLSPWRRRGRLGIASPLPGETTAWSEVWQPAEERLAELESELRAAGATVRRGGDFDRWDLEVRGGTLASARLRVGIEEHGAGRQLIRYRWWARPARFALGLLALLAALSAGALLGHAIGAALILSALTLTLALRCAFDSVLGAASVRQVLSPRLSQAQSIAPTAAAAANQTRVTG